MISKEICGSIFQEFNMRVGFGPCMNIATIPLAVVRLLVHFVTCSCSFVTDLAVKELSKSGKKNN